MNHKNYTDALIESIINLLSTDEYIAYIELEDYFNRYYFNNGRKTLLPYDAEGWEILHNLKEIEEGIYKRSDIEASGLARVCIFYNTYVLEHWLLNHDVFINDTEFIPDNPRDTDINQDPAVLPSHEYLRKCYGDDVPDFMYIDSTNKVITMDLKFLKRNQFGRQEVTFAAHNANYVIAYSPVTNKLYLYRQKYNNSKYKNLYISINREKKLDEELTTKLIPWRTIMSNNNLYFDWNKIFALEPKLL